MDTIQKPILAMIQEMEDRYGREKVRFALSTIILTDDGTDVALGSLRDQTAQLIHRADRGDVVLLEEAENDHPSRLAAIHAVIAKAHKSWPTTPSTYYDDARLAAVRHVSRVWFDIRTAQGLATQDLLTAAIKRGFIPPLRKRKKRKGQRNAT